MALKSSQPFRIADLVAQRLVYLPESWLHDPAGRVYCFACGQLAVATTAGVGLAILMTPHDGICFVVDCPGCGTCTLFCKTWQGVAYAWHFHASNHSLTVNPHFSLVAGLPQGLVRGMLFRDNTNAPVSLPACATGMLTCRTCRSRIRVPSHTTLQDLEFDNCFVVENLHSYWLHCPTCDWVVRCPNGQTTALVEVYFKK